MEVEKYVGLSYKVKSCTRRLRNKEGFGRDSWGQRVKYLKCQAKVVENDTRGSGC